MEALQDQAKSKVESLMQGFDLDSFLNDPEGFMNEFSLELGKQVSPFVVGAIELGKEFALNAIRY